MHPSARLATTKATLHKAKIVASACAPTPSSLAATRKAWRGPAEAEQDKALRLQEEHGREAQQAGQHRRRHLVALGGLLLRHELGRLLNFLRSYVSTRGVCDERLRSGHATAQRRLG